jgi:hypothetical protein
MFVCLFLSFLMVVELEALFRLLRIQPLARLPLYDQEGPKGSSPPLPAALV